MPTAILYSGQLRSFSRCYPTQRWHVLRHFSDLHFFFTIQDQPDAAEILAPLIADYGADRVHIDLRTDPDLTADLTPQLSAAYHAAPYANAAPAHQLLLQHWYQAACWRQFKEESEKLKPITFDTIIRLRPDLYFHSLELPAFLDSSTSHFDWRAAAVCTPWWGRFGGLNDRFAIMGAEAARAYFDVYAKIPELLALGCPFHPESLLAARLEMANQRVTETIRAEFSTLRTNGTSRPPEISPIDLAHCALR